MVSPLVITRNAERAQWEGRAGEGKSGKCGAAKGHYKSRGPVGPRPIRVLLLQHESNLYIDLVALDVAILNQDVLVLHPRPFHASKRLGSTGHGLIDSVLEARLGRSAQLGYSGNTHTYLCLLAA